MRQRAANYIASGYQTPRLYIEIRPSKAWTGLGVAAKWRFVVISGSQANSTWPNGRTENDIKAPMSRLI